MNNRRLLAVASAVLCLLLPVGADQMYIRNRPFKGSVKSSEGKLWVELKPLSEAFQVSLIDNGAGGYAIAAQPLTPEELAALPANKLLLQGESLDIQEVDGAPHIPLDHFAKLMNAKVIVNKQMKTIDVSVASAPQVVASTPTRAGGSSAAPPPAGTLRLHGKVTLEGANAVGLFDGGSSSTPYKTGTVDSRGNYTIDIDLAKDMHPYERGVTIADMRFYKNGAFGECHGRCNFIMKAGKRTELQVYQGPTYEIKGNDFEYSEAR